MTAGLLAPAPVRVRRMTDESTPLLPVGPGRFGRVERSVVRWGLGAAVRASLLVSPRPAALLVRKVFAAGGAKTAEGLARHAPGDVTVLADQRYGAGPDMLLDVYRPEPSADRPLPLVLWVHGGGFVGGSKEELAGWFRLIAGSGYVVAAPRYSLAPEHRYPAPPRQVMQALAYLQSEAGRLGIDADRMALGGDSAGAHIAAQTGLLVTTPGYAKSVGITPAVTPAQLRGLVLACGPYDVGLGRAVTDPAGRRFMQVVMWAYTGRRHFFDDADAGSWSVTDNITPGFPPTLLTVGDADPLRAHSELLAERLRAEGVPTETAFFPDGHRPPLNHEYQFDLDTEAGQQFFRHMLAFLDSRLAQPGAGS
jgi:acetyl esterase/lipase